jgi:predicted small lipoprotein YifL
MFAHRNTSTDVLGAVVVVGMMSLASACGGTSPLQQPTSEPNAQQSEQSGEETTTQKEHVGTGSALGESIPPPVSQPQDAGPHQDKRNSPDAGPAPAAVPTPKKK